MKDFFRATVAGVYWWIRREWLEIFLSPGGLKLRQWLNEGQAVIVKHGPHRIVYRVELPELTFYVKRNLIPDKKAWLRYILRGSKACREAKYAREIAARGVATIEPLAVGERIEGSRRGESFLITRSLEQVQQLNDFIEHCLPGYPLDKAAQIRIRLAKKLGVFLAQIHNAGILHNDLHCGNILIRLDEKHQPHLYLVDLQSVRLRQPLCWKKSRANLMVLSHWLLMRSSRSDRLRFWRAYTHERTRAQAKDPNSTEAAGCQPHEWADLERAFNLESASKESLVSLWRRRERRFFRRNRRIRRVKTANVQGFALTDLDKDFLRRLAEDPDEPFRRSDITWLKKSQRGDVVEFSAPFGQTSRQVVYKRFTSKEPTDSLAALVRRTPALRSWLYGHCLRERGLATARPLAVMQRKRWGLVQEGYLLMEKVEAAGDLHHALSTLQELPPLQRQALLRRRIEQLARLIRELHHRRLAHRDLKAANILMLNEEPGQVEQKSNTTHSVGFSSPFCFIDLVGVSRQWRVSKKLRVKNLARLHASFCNDSRITRTDKLRFLREYLQWGLFGRQGWKDWWRTIERATERKVAKNKRNGRELA